MVALIDVRFRKSIGDTVSMLSDYSGTIIGRQTRNKIWTSLIRLAAAIHVDEVCGHRFACMQTNCFNLSIVSTNRRRRH